MARRIDRYRIQPGIDLGDPDVLTTIFEDLDNRLHVQELNGQAIDERADQLERVALSRLNDVFTGVLRDAQGKLQDTGAWFKAESQTSFIPEIGAQQFTLTEETRGGYVSTRDILIVSASDDTHFLIAKLVSYVPIDGKLDVIISEAFGNTEKSDWLIYPLAVGESGHMGRTDNPHGVTAEQVDAYTKGETDQAIEDAKSDIRSGASAAYDTLDEIEAELNSGSTARAALVSQIAGKLDRSSDIDMEGHQIENVSSINGGTMGGFRNKIINGDFDVWQRGTSQTVTGYGSADRWKCSLSNVTGSVDRQDHAVGQSDVAGNPKHFLRFSVSAYSGEFNISQKIEDVRTFAGKTVTLSFYARASAATVITPYFSQNFGSGGSGSIGYSQAAQNITTSWQRFDVVINLPPIIGKTVGDGSDLEIYPLRVIQSFTGTIDIDRISLVEGDATQEDDPFSPRHIGQELALCQRYYQKVGMTRGSGSNAAGGSTVMFSHNIPKMRVAPSLSHINVSGAYNWSNRHFTNTTDCHVAVIADVNSGYWYYNDGYEADAEL